MDIVFSVNERGQVTEVEVIESYPDLVFDQAATDAALRWRFRPVVEDGEPVTALRQVRINFTLESGVR